MCTLRAVYEWLRVPTTANHSLKHALRAVYEWLRVPHHSQSQSYARLTRTLCMPMHTLCIPYVHLHTPDVHLMCTLHAPYVCLMRALCMSTCALRASTRLTRSL